MIKAVVSRPALTTHTFSVEDYYRMAEVGILSPDDRVELLNGQVVEMSPTGSIQAARVTFLSRLLTIALKDCALVRVQQPLAIDNLNEPEPDIAVVDYRDDLYASGHPTPNAVRLVIEVAKTSIEKDAGLKASLYARAGVLEYWIVNLADGCVEIFREPETGRYGKLRLARGEDMIGPEAFTQVRIRAADVLGQ